MLSILSNYEVDKVYKIKFIKDYRKKKAVYKTDDMKLIQKTDNLLIFQRNSNQGRLCISINDLIDESVKVL